MKLVFHITAYLVIPLALIYIAFGTGTLVVLLPKTEDWRESIEAQIVREELSSISGTTRTLGAFTSTIMGNIVRDVRLLHDYATQIYGNSVSPNFAYAALEASAPPSPPPTSGREQPRYFSKSGTAATPAALTNATTMTNLWRPMAAGNPAYSGLYIGLESDLFVIYPAQDISGYASLSYTCLTGGNPSATVGYDPRCRSWYVDAKANPGQVVFTQPYVDAASGLVLISAAQAVFDSSGGFVGVVSVDVSMDTLARSIQRSRFPGGYAFVVEDTSEGAIVVHPGRGFDEVYTIFDTEFPAGTNVFPIIRASAEGQIYTTKNGAPVVVSWNKVVTSGHIVISVVPSASITVATREIKDTVESRQDTAIILNVLIGIAMLVLGVGAIYLVSRRIVRPINELNRVTGALKEGNVNVEVEADATAPEFTAIASQFALLIRAMQFANKAFLSHSRDKALEIYKDVAASMEEIENPYGQGVAYNNIALTYGLMDGREVEARQYFARAIDLAEHLHEIREDPGDMSMKKTHANRIMNLGVLAMNLGQYSEAMDNFDLAIRMHKQIKNDLGVLQAVGNKGALLLDQDDTEEARDLLVAAYVRAQRKYYASVGMDPESGKRGKKNRNKRSRRRSSLDEYDETSITMTTANTDSAMATVEGDILQYAAMNMGVYWKKMGESESNDRKKRKAYNKAIGHFNEALTLQASIDANLQSMCLAHLASIYEDQGDDERADEFRALIVSSDPKHVLFVLDTSGSMAGSRIKECRSSVVTILESYMYRNDVASLMVFNDSVSWVFSQENVTKKLRDLKGMTARGTRCTGGTAFYDALLGSIHHVRDAEIENTNQWIVALTDGEDNRSRTAAAVVARAVRDNSINIIIITVGTLQNRAAVQSITDAAEQGRGILITAEGTEAISSAFSQAVEVINAGQVKLEAF